MLAEKITARDQAKLHLAILGEREHYHVTAKNYRNNDVINGFVKKNDVISVLMNLNDKGYTTWVSLNSKIKDSIKGVCRKSQGSLCAH